MVSESISKTMSLYTLDELNYLAAKIQALPSDGFEVFAAALEAKRHCGSVAEIINLTENLDRFYIQPAQTPGMYGDFLLDMQKDDIVFRVRNTRDCKGLRTGSSRERHEFQIPQ